jgi:MGT family glycosyltransferase
MARFLFASTPVAAHSATPRPIVRRLVERGHEVVWYGGHAYADRIRATGARYAPMVDALDVSGGDPYDWFPELRELEGLAAIKASFREIFLGQIPPTVADLESVLDHFPADVVATDILVGRAANIVSERGGPPPATLNDTALPPAPPEHPPWGKGLLPRRGPLNRLRNHLLQVALEVAFADLQRDYLRIRHDHGLGNDDRWLFDTGRSRFLHLQGTVPEFEYRHRHPDPTVHFVGPFRPDPPSAWTPPDWWSELDGTRPVVHVTQGTIRADGGELVRPAIEALAGEDLDVVVTTGAIPLDDLGPLPPNVRAAPFIPYDALLARADVFLTNGGYVGTNLALSHGVPVVQVGDTEDKAEIGARVAYSGVGRRLRTTEPAPSDIRRAVRRVLRDDRYRRRAESVARTMSRCDATATSVELLERLAAEQRPLTRTGGGSSPVPSNIHRRLPVGGVSSAR